MHPLPVPSIPTRRMLVPSSFMGKVPLLFIRRKDLVWDDICQAGDSRGSNSWLPDITCNSNKLHLSIVDLLLTHVT